MFTSSEIRNIDFEVVKRGYNQTDVRAFLRKISEQIDASEQEKQRFESEKAAFAGEKSDIEQKMLILAERVEEYRKDEDSLRSALLSAQKLGDTIVRESNENAEIILNDARKKSKEILDDAAAKVELEKRTLERLQNEVSKFKNEVLSIYKSHLEILSMIPETEEKPEAAPVAAEEEIPEISELEINEETIPETAVYETAVSETVVFGTEPEVSEEPQSYVSSAEEDVFYSPENRAEDETPFAGFESVLPDSPEPAEDFPSLPEQPESVQSKDDTNRFGKLDFGDGFSFTTK